jgi:hypothetical protein
VRKTGGYTKWGKGDEVHECQGRGGKTSETHRWTRMDAKSIGAHGLMDTKEGGVSNTRVFAENWNGIVAL